MRTQTRQMIVGLAPVVITFLIAAGVFFRLTYGFTFEFGFDTRDSKSNSDRDKTKDGEPTSSPLIVVSPSPVSSPMNEKPAIKTIPVNITDQWISERSLKSYFISEVGNRVEIYESDSNQRKKLVGSGIREEDKIILQFYSTLDEVDGTLKLQVSQDGKSMTGRFTALGDATKEGDIRMIRTAF